MHLKLSEHGPPMWFLGDPKALILSLTISEPGPITVDFSELDRAAQAKVLVGIRDGILQSDVTFQDLYKEYERLQRKRAKESELDEADDQQIESSGRDQMFKAEAKERVKGQKLEERCDHLAGTTAQGLISTVARENNLTFLQTLLRAEQSARNRKTVTKVIKKRIEVVKRQALLEEEKKSKERLAKEGNAKTMGYSVVESELETVTLSPEELVMFSEE